MLDNIPKVILSENKDIALKYYCGGIKILDGLSFNFSKTGLSNLLVC